MRLILFDVDGTLVTSSRIGRAALDRALQEVFGTVGALATYEFAGKTDRGIIHDLMTAAGYAPAEIVRRHAAMDERMAAAGRVLFTGETLQACPGVPELLAVLRRRENVTLALLTGNLEATTPLKLAAAGIDPRLFVAGAYGSESRERNELLSIAVRRVAEATGLNFSGEDIIVVGDTPADIQCARAGGCLALAVATGPYRVEVLARHEPDFLHEDLSRTDAVLNDLLQVILK
jgi:phosphoglycolate phosphatase-like HAD superfamily hydrolase